jgi:hypothetical protein
MTAQIEGKNSSSEPRIIDILKEGTKWHYVCDAIEILTGGRNERYIYEGAIAAFVIKSWLSSSKSLLFAFKNAPTIFCCLILSEKINEIRKQKEFRMKPFVNFLNNANLTRTLNVTFMRRNIVEFLINNTWRPHRSGVTNEKHKFEIERLNKLTEYRLRLGNEGYNFAANDAALLLGKMQRELSWKPTTVKEIHSRWKEKEAFLFVGRVEEFASVVSFNALKTPDLLQAIKADAVNHKRNSNYFAKVKGIISELTPETSRELEKYERWRKIENPSPIPLESFDDNERTRIDELGIKPTVRRSAEETKAAGRQRPWSK